MKIKMMLLGCACTLISGMAVKAQKIKFGQEIGASISNVRTKGGNPYRETDARAGIKIAGFADIALNKTISFQPGIAYDQKGFTEHYIEMASGNSARLTRREVYKYRINYLELPMNVQFSFNAPRHTRVFVGGGPYVAFAVGGKYQYDAHELLSFSNGDIYRSVDTKRDIRIGNYAGSDSRRTDAGVNLNIGAMCSHGFFLRGNAGFGLANMIPVGSERYSARNMSGSITAGYMFGR